MMNDTPQSRSENWRGRLMRLRKHARSAAPFVAGLAAAFTAIWIYNALNPAPRPLSPRELNETIANVMASATPPPAPSVFVHQAIRPSLIFVETKLARAQNGDANQPEMGLGSGVVVNEQGDILTSLHVVENAEEIKVTYADGTESVANIVGNDPEHDIAVLRPESPPPIAIPAVLGNPSAMRIGDEAYAVGNPLGFYSSMSAGVVSGLERSFQPKNSEQKLEGLIQFDAAVNPGNSGGPLLNRYGQVIGIVVGLVNPTDQNAFAGIGFAVPINVAGGAAGLPNY
jgi:S1-C subfamily serine protease